MLLQDIKPNKNAVKSRMRKGRGTATGKGKTSGRGMKGARQRSGFNKESYFEGGQTPLYRRIPKRGFKNKFAEHYQVVNISQLDKKFEDGAKIGKAKLKETGLIDDSSGLVKILSEGETNKKFFIEADGVSKKAKEKIENSGGKINS